MASLKTQFESEEDELRRVIQQEQQRQVAVQGEREAMARSRRVASAARTTGGNGNSGKR